VGKIILVTNRIKVEELAKTMVKSKHHGVQGRPFLDSVS
jgi:hypothetical protein